MDMKKIIQCLIILLVVSAACAGIYAAEAGEVSHDESSSHPEGLYISGSGEVCHVINNTDAVNQLPQETSIDVQN